MRKPLLEKGAFPRAPSLNFCTFCSSFRQRNSSFDRLGFAGGNLFIFLVECVRDGIQIMTPPLTVADVQPFGDFFYIRPTLIEKVLHGPAAFLFRFLPGVARYEEIGVREHFGRGFDSGRAVRRVPDYDGFPDEFSGRGVVRDGYQANMGAVHPDSEFIFQIVTRQVQFLIVSFDKRLEKVPDEAGAQNTGQGMLSIKEGYKISISRIIEGKKIFTHARLFIQIGEYL